MGFSWQGVDDYLSYKLEQRDRERAYEKEKADRLELYNRQRQDKLTDLLGVEMRKRMEDLRAKRSARARTFAKGKSLYGARIATALENTGQLGDVLANYEANKSPKEQIEVVIASTQDFLDRLATSDKPEDQKKLASILTRASDDKSEAELSDYISGVLADGVISYEEYYGMPAASVPGAGDFGVVPNLGERNVYTPTQVMDAAKEIAVSLTPGSQLVVDNQGNKKVTLGPNMSSEQFQLRVNKVANYLEDNQYSMGAIPATSSATDYFIEQWKTPAPTPTPTEGVPELEGIQGISEETETVPTTEAMTEADVQPVLTPEVTSTPKTGWSDAEQELMNRRGNR